jgi:hypothetical protein
LVVGVGVSIPRDRGKENMCESWKVEGDRCLWWCDNMSLSSRKNAG